MSANRYITCPFHRTRVLATMGVEVQGQATAGLEEKGRTYLLAVCAKHGKAGSVPETRHHATGRHLHGEMPILRRFTWDEFVAEYEKRR